MRYYIDSLTGIKYSLCLKKNVFTGFLDSIKVPKGDKPDFVSVGKEATVHHLETSGGVHIVMCFKDLSKFSEVENLGLLLHECVHVWQFIVEWMGEESPGYEVEAYSIQSIFVNMLSEMRRKTSK